jgi:hypothetical protein
MAVHNLFMGGQKANSCTIGSNMFPSMEMGQCEPWAADYRKSNVEFSLTREFNWGCAPAGGCTDCGQERGSQALKQYLNENTIAVGDIINAVGIPMLGIVTGVWWVIKAPAAGFTFDIQIRGAVGTSVPAPVVIGTVDGGPAAPLAGSCSIPSGYFHLTTPLYFDHNDMLQLVITGLPAAPAGGCGSCGQNGIGLTDFIVAPQYREFCRGDVMDGSTTM